MIISRNWEFDIHPWFRGWADIWSPDISRELGSRGEKAMAPTPALLPGKSHGWRSLVGCSPWGRSESDTTERLHLHFSLSCIGEGNGNPLQCSRLENPRDGGAWWLPSVGLHRVGHDWSDLAAAAGSCGMKTALDRLFGKQAWLTAVSPLAESLTLELYKAIYYLSRSSGQQYELIYSLVMDEIWVFS